MTTVNDKLTEFKNTPGYVQNSLTLVKSDNKMAIYSFLIANGSTASWKTHFLVLDETETNIEFLSRTVLDSKEIV